jgi:hypothetical protein
MAARTGNILFFLLALFLYANASDARTWYVKPDSTGDAPTIQAAIDSAQAGDEVVLAPGTYTHSTQGDNGHRGNRSMIELKAGVNLRSELGPEVTVLDAERGPLGGPRVIWGEDVGAVLIDGLTLMRGVASGYGGAGIAVIGNSTPTISNCIIRDCLVGIFASGGGMWFGQPTIPTIRHCQLLNNRALDGSGGGISCRGGTIDSCIFRGNSAASDPGGDGGALSCRDTQVRDCIFENNTAGGPFGGVGGAINDAGGSQITGCKFVGNRAAASVSGSALGAGVSVLEGSSVISDCVFVGNLVAGDAFGAAVYGSTGSDVRVERCTIVGNVAQDLGGAIRGVAGVVLTGSARVSNSIVAFNEGRGCTSNGTYSCNVLFGNTLGESICGVDGGGNIFADPQFCAVDPVASMNFLLQNDSPCAPTNNGSCGLIGAFPVGCSSVSTELRSWSEVKSMFRR